MSKNSSFAKYLSIGGAVFLTIVIPAVFFANSMDLVGGAEIFPMLMSGIMLFCGAMSFYGKFREGDVLGNPIQVVVSFPKFLIIASILLLFIPMVEFLGFYSTNFIYIVAGFLFLTGGVSRKYFSQAVAVAGLFVLVEKLIFYDLLTILTPTGLLF